MIEAMKTNNTHDRGKAKMHHRPTLPQTLLSRSIAATWALTGSDPIDPGYS